MTSLGERPVAGHGRNRIAAVAAAIAVVAAAYVTVGLVVLLPDSGYTSVQLGFLSLVVAISWIGVAGAVLDRPPVVIVAAVALMLLGFWQAVLWVFMLPAALGLVLAGVILAHLA